MSQIFVSYARADRGRVAKLVGALEAWGWSVFWDREIPPGATWPTHLEEVVREANCVVVVWSQASVDPERHWVRVEAAEGKERGILVPAQIDPVKPPFGFGLIQAADLVGWDGDEEAPEFHRLVTSIEKLVSSGSAGANEIWAKPGEKGMPPGIYEERDGEGNELPGLRRRKLGSKEQPLPPTSKQGHWWTKVSAAPG